MQETDATLAAEDLDALLDECAKETAMCNKRKILERFQVMADGFREDPFVLDTKMQTMMQRLQTWLFGTEEAQEQRLVLRFVYVLAAVRGAKTVALFLQHDTQQMHILARLASFLREAEIECDASWRVATVALLWASVFAKVPFPLAAAASSSAFSAATFEQLKTAALQRLGSPTADRKAAARFLASLCRRSDCDAAAILTNVFDLSPAEASPYRAVGEAQFVLFFVRSNPPAACVPLEGVLQRLFEATKNLAANGAASLYSKCLLKIASVLVQDAPQLFARISGVAFEMAMRLTAASEITLRSQAACTVCRIVQCTASNAESLQMLLVPIADKPSVHFSAWSVARVHGTLCLMAEVVRLRLFECLYAAFGEFFARIAAFVRFCLFFDGAVCNTGVASTAYVRDAACYFLWSAAKFASSSSLEPDVAEAVIADVWCVALFDADVNCRRAAAACAQQWIGRVSTLQTCGWRLIERLNFVSLSLAAACYGKLAVEAACIDAHLAPLFARHLLMVRRVQQASDLRRLAAETFAQLIPFIDEAETEAALCELLRDLASNDPILVHGSLLFLASVVREGVPSALESFERVWLHKIAAKFSATCAANTILEALVQFVVAVQTAKNVPSIVVLESFDAAVCFVDAASRHPSAKIDFCLVKRLLFDGIALLLKRELTPIDDTLLIRCHFPVDKPLGSFGFALLCALPASHPAIKPSIDAAFGCTFDRFVRRNASAVCDVQEEADFLLTVQSFVALNGGFLLGDAASSCLLQWIRSALNNYTINSRGDVGCTVREAALELLVELAQSSSNLPANLWDFVADAVRIVCEKLPRLKKAAIKVIRAFLAAPCFQSPPNEILVAYMRNLCASFDSAACTDETLYAHLLQIFAVECDSDLAANIRYAVCAGVVKCIASQTVHVIVPVLAAVRAFFAQASSLRAFVSVFVRFTCHRQPNAVHVLGGFLSLAEVLFTRHTAEMGCDLHEELLLAVQRAVDRCDIGAKNFSVAHASVNVFSAAGCVKRLLALGESHPFPRIRLFAMQMLVLHVQEMQPQPLTDAEAAALFAQANADARDAQIHGFIEKMRLFLLDTPVDR